MNNEEEKALLWKLNIKSLRDLKDEHQAHIRREKALREKRLQLKEHEKRELKRRDELLGKIRNCYDTAGVVGAHLKGYSFRFLLGEHRKSGGLIAYEESKARLHPTKNVVSLWRDQAHLDDFLRKKVANDEYFRKERKKGTGDLRIAQRLPNPSINLMCSYACELNVDKLSSLIEGHKEQLYKSFGDLPRKPQQLIYDSASVRGPCCILEVLFKP